MSDRGVVARVARWVADSDRVPTAQRAVLGHYAETGTLDYRALGLKSEVDDAMEGILTALYDDVEAALCEAFDVDDAAFTYETKLTLPAELTLGYLFRQARSRAEGGYDPVTDGHDSTADEPTATGRGLSLPTLGGRPDGTAHRRRANREAAALVRDAREMTAFVVAALLDGDMRDAINDDEFEDFVVDLEADVDRRRVATVAQSCLEERVAAGFAEYPDGVRAAYDHAVDVSEAHQAEDDRFRALLAAATGDSGDRGNGSVNAGSSAGTNEDRDRGENGGDDDHQDVDGTRVELTPEAAREAIETEYKHRPMADDDHPFTDAELDLPYLATQYDRVGVIYHGMLEMYRQAGFDVEETFERSIVFTIVGAQVWLDDVDDYADDVVEGQLTPVTAEYVLADTDREAFETIVDVAETYFDRGRRYAEAADSTLTGLAVEYVLRSGDASHLPGAEG